MKRVYFNWVVVLTIICLAGCQAPKLPLINSATFETAIDGKPVKLYTLENKSGLTVQITNLGGRVVGLWVPDKDGNFVDISIGYKTAQDYVNSNERYYGATIGRYGNRIGKGLFTLEGDTFQLDLNNHGNTLHGGSKGFCEVVWEGNQVDKNTLELTYLSPDGEQGFPGNLKTKVVYQLTDNNELKVEYRATTDKPTVVNLTHHSFFNLKGEGNGTINDHLLYINANAITPVDSLLIPTGEIVPVEGTPFDFRKATSIGERVDEENEQLGYGLGYDHNFVLNTAKEGLTHAATVKAPATGISMEIHTNEPGLQFYGGNFMNGSDVGKYGIPFKHREAFCLETQHFPDSPNQPNFPSTTLKPGEEYYSICVHKFSAE